MIQLSYHSKYLFTGKIAQLITKLVSILKFQILHNVHGSIQHCLLYCAVGYAQTSAA